MTDRPAAASDSRDVVLSVRNVSKKFARDLKRSMAYGFLDMVREIASARRHTAELRPSEFWAVDNVSFDLWRGESLGLVGRNGSGKSTLLRLISGIFKPDKGSVRYEGKIAALIALGAGFNPVLTGRENVITNLAILGLSRREIQERVEEVLDFADIGDAIDAPLQTYSSGMSARLGFACAIHTRPDILLIDEVLSVGDAKFRGKCYRKLHELRRSGVATILVTHNVNAVLSMTDRAIYLSKGRMVMNGAPAAVMSRYEEDLVAIVDAQPAAVNGPADPQPHDRVGLTIDSVRFVDDRGHARDPVVAGRPAQMSVRYRATRDIPEVGLGVIVRELVDESEVVLNLHSERDGKVFAVGPGQGTIDVSFPALGLRPGLYTAKVYLSAPGMYQYDMVESYRFRVVAKENMSQCLYYQPREWRMHVLDAAVAADARVGDPARTR
jgi:lipopolysaccharide transport system ATP-binding protein